MWVLVVADVGVAASSVLVRVASATAVEARSVVALGPVVGSADMVLDETTTTTGTILGHQVHQF